MTLPDSFALELSFSEKIKLARYALDEASACFVDTDGPSPIDVSDAVSVLDAAIRAVECRNPKTVPFDHLALGDRLHRFLRDHVVDLHHETPEGNRQDPSFHVALLAINALGALANSVTFLAEKAALTGDDIVSFDEFVSESWILDSVFRSTVALRRDGTLRLLNTLFPAERIGADLRIARLVETYIENGLPEQDVFPAGERPVVSLLAAVREAKRTVDIIESFDT